MYKVLLVLSLVGALLACTNEKQTNISKQKIVYVKITYMNLFTSYFEPLTPSGFYKAKDLTEKLIKEKGKCDSIAYYIGVLSINPKAKFQEVIDPRVALKIKYNDSTSKSVYIDTSGEYMFDTVGTVFAKDKSFIRYLERLINDEMVKWVE